MKICKKSAGIGLIVGVVIILGTSLFINIPTKQQFIYVNFDKVISHVMSEVNRSNGGAMVTEEVENYKGLFVKTLDEYAKSNNAIVFSSPKPVSGAKDATDLLIEKAFGDAFVEKERVGGKRDE